MLKRFAEETTVHGFKEASLAGRVGRLFWVVIFVGAFTAMVFQLQALFISYIDEEVSTRITSTKNVESVHVPSLYYCQRHWLPAADEFKHMIECSEGSPGMSANSFRDRCYSRFAKASIVEEILDGLFLASAGGIRGSPNEVGVHTAYMKSKSHQREVLNLIRAVFDEIEGKYGGDIVSYLQNKIFIEKIVLDSYKTKRVMPNGTYPAHGLITRTNVEFPKFKAWEARAAFTYDKYDTRDGAVSVNMNGVCWEIKPEQEESTPSMLSANYQTHFVIHLGAYIYTLNPLLQRSGYDYTGENGYRPFVHKVPFNLLIPPSGVGAEKVHWLRRLKFYTNLFVAEQGQTLPLFQHGVRLTGKTRSVMVKFSSRKEIYHNRKSFPCRLDWTPLDRAHCNQEDGLKNALPWDSRCKIYLPRSQHYPATPLNQTCKVSSLGAIISQIWWSENKQSSIDDEEREFLEQLRQTGAKPTLPQAKVFMGTPNPNCPPPCSELDYKLEVTYPEMTNEYEDECSYATDYLLRSSAVTTDRERARGFYKTKDYFPREWNKTGAAAYPCTKVLLIQSELDGAIYEEYPLCTISDLLSNVGGTLGLWIGASVISFIQCIYLFCLERFLAKREEVTVAPGDVEGGDGGMEDERNVKKEYPEDVILRTLKLDRWKSVDGRGRDSSRSGRRF